MRFLGFISVILVVLVLSWSSARETAWALGEQPNFSGVIANWALGDAIQSSEAPMWANYHPSYDLDDNEEGRDVALGHIDANGSFSFGLIRGAAGVAETPGWFYECPNIQASDPEVKVAVLEKITIPAHYEEGVHARPLGHVIISTQPFTANKAASRQNYIFIYADRKSIYKGSCVISDEDFSLSVAFDLELFKGWNSVLFELGNGMRFSTGAIPGEAQWYFVNPLTISGE